MKTLIIGAGAAGVGMGVVLKKMGLAFEILEQATIGQSFKNWPAHTRFISPSFTGNAFGAPDLNAVCPDTSPAHTLQTQHPSGLEYAEYLQHIADFYKLPIQEKTKVKRIKKVGKHFQVETEHESKPANAVIWAGGEYQFPKTAACKGAELAVHNTQVPNIKQLQGEHFAIIGGYESGFDTAIALAKQGKQCLIFDSQDRLMDPRSDASFSISPCTKDRLLPHAKNIQIKPNSRVEAIKKDGDEYLLTTEHGEVFRFETQPILATGFTTSLSQVRDFFTWEKSTPLLSQHDESTKTPHFFLVGPQVSHGKAVFCFVYKFRQRFVVVAQRLAELLGLSSDPRVQAVVADYQRKHCFLQNLSCCEDECTC